MEIWHNVCDVICRTTYASNAVFHYLAEWTEQYSTKKS